MSYRSVDLTTTVFLSVSIVVLLFTGHWLAAASGFVFYFVGGINAINWMEREAENHDR